MKYLKVAAVIVTFNREKLLENCLISLLNQTRPLDEIIVIDNASYDATEEMVGRKFPQITYIKLKENEGSAGGFYEGIKIAVENNDLVWTFDDDVSVDKNALESLMKWLDILEKTERVGVVRSYVSKFSPFNGPKKTDGFAWRGTLIKKEVIKEIGLPKREYFLYADDAEYSLRITKNGYAIFLIPESLVIEKHAADKMRFKVFGKETILYTENFRFYYAIRNQVSLYFSYRDFYRLFTSICYAIKLIFLFIVFKRLKCVEAIINGLWDGLRLKLGKNEKYLPVL